MELEMTLKIITHPETGKTFKMGRVRPRVRQPRLALLNYLGLNLPKPPDGPLDYTAKAKTFLAEVLANDSLGDCTCAGIMHVGGAFLGNVDQSIPFTEADTIGLYEKVCGYNPSDPSTDQGGNEQDVLNYVKANGLLADGSHKIAAWAGVNGAEELQVKTAIWLFENVYFGVELPDAWVNPMPSGDGFVWDVAGDANPEQGHCFVGLGYTDQGVMIDTWGMIGIITWAAIAKYATSHGSGELYTVFGPDSLSKASAKCPAGFDATQLAADIQAYAG
jgi:hypothetical protein